jgi:tetratricopeptide (TPR) repeat protein
MTKDEALKLALEALKSAAAELYRASSYCNTYEVIGNTNDAITAIQKALAAQPAVQEPVAWGVIASNTGRICQVELDADEVEGHNPKHIIPLYTTPHAQLAPGQYTALEQALTRLQKRYAELEAKVAAQPKEEDLYDLALKADNGGQP